MATVFDRLVPSALRSSSTPVLKDGEFNAMLLQNLNIKILAFTSAESRPLDKYECFLVRPAHTGQKQYISLSQRGTGLRLGYVFPINSLAEDSSFEGWEGKYAKVAVESLLASELACSHLRVTKVEEVVSAKGISITEVFIPDLGIVVLGKENLATANCTSNMVRMMIQEHGIRILRDSVPLEAPPSRGGFASSLTVRDCSPMIKDDLGQFCYLIEIAEQQQYLPAKFLILYQIVEALISRIYENSIRAIVQDPRIMNNVWNLRDEFEKVSSEKSRINKLFGEFIYSKSGEVNERTERLKTAGISFLVKADPTAGPETASSTAIDLQVSPEALSSLILTHDPKTIAVDDGMIVKADLSPAASAENDSASVSHSRPVRFVQQTGTALAAVLSTNSNHSDLSQKGCAEILYRCRNLIVHRQWQMKVIAEEELGELCSALEQLLFLTISVFTAKPER